MKRNAIAALALAGALVMSGCRAKSSETRTTYKTSKSTTTSETEEPSSSETETEAPTESETTSTESSESTTMKETTIAETAPAPMVLSYDDDPIDFYKSAAYQIPESLIGGLSGGTASWETVIRINTTKRNLSGQYESVMPNLDDDSYDIQRGEFSGLIEEFVRANDYSYKTKIHKISYLEFEDKDEEYQGKTAHVKSCKPYGFDKVEELILYLPNTPMSELPKEALEWVEMFLSYPNEQYLSNYVLYSPSDGTAFIIYRSTFPSTEKTKKEEMEGGWFGIFTADEGTAEVFYDEKLGEVVANVRIEGANVYNRMIVRQFVGDPSNLVLYGTSDAGTTVVLSLCVGDGTTCLAVYESNDPGLNENTFIYPHKTSVERG
ncbi:MAG: hypothetical protein IKG93_03645 [Clostridiales bacterium]|nr:hypothetical protein [Clostridiales bacterium]